MNLRSFDFSRRKTKSKKRHANRNKRHLRIKPMKDGRQRREKRQRFNYHLLPSTHVVISCLVSDECSDDCKFIILTFSPLLVGCSMSLRQFSLRMSHMARIHGVRNLMREQPFNQEGIFLSSSRLSSQSKECSEMKHLIHLFISRPLVYDIWHVILLFPRRKREGERENESPEETADCLERDAASG